jgi:hypothetical protein
LFTSAATAQPRWPRIELHALPDLPEAETLARDVRVAMCGLEEWDRGPVDIEAVSVAGAFSLIERELGGAAGGLEALLLPGTRDAFKVIVDTEPPGGWVQVREDLRHELARHRLRFRAAHEWAHSLFYERTPTGPMRLVADSDAQEEFCDRFAAALLVPPAAAAAAAPSTEGVLALHRRFDVSLELALRAVVAQHPHAATWLFVVPDDEQPFLQWRSSASYKAGIDAEELVAVIRRRGSGAPGLDMVMLERRRQALVFAPS